MICYPVEVECLLWFVYVPPCFPCHLSSGRQQQQRQTFISSNPLPSACEQFRAPHTMHHTSKPDSRCALNRSFQRANFNKTSLSGTGTVATASTLIDFSGEVWGSEQRARLRGLGIGGECKPVHQHVLIPASHNLGLVTLPSLDPDYSIRSCSRLCTNGWRHLPKPCGRSSERLWCCLIGGRSA